MNKKIRKEIEKYQENYQKYHAPSSPYMDYYFEHAIPYAGKELPPLEQGNEDIKNLLYSGKPVMIARFGESELKAMLLGLMYYYPVLNPVLYHQISVKSDNLFFGAGFFPRNINLLPKFSQVMLQACKQVDMLAVWFNRCEDYVIEHYLRDVKLCRLASMEPFYCGGMPWTEVLSGKRVLVIHPFAETIRKQYTKREKLFPDREILPQFELLTLEAVQTIAGQRDARFENWFDALEYMYQETLKYNYDIAIVGCGAYGFPLSAKIKQSGHSVIQLCGATQILFGIRGKRWDEHEVISRLYNEYWCRPDSSEIPNKAQMVEGGCYW